MSDSRISEPPVPAEMSAAVHNHHIQTMARIHDSQVEMRVTAKSTLFVTSINLLVGTLAAVFIVSYSVQYTHMTVTTTSSTDKSVFAQPPPLFGDMQLGRCPPPAAYVPARSSIAFPFPEQCHVDSQCTTTWYDWSGPPRSYGVCDGDGQMSDWIGYPLMRDLSDILLWYPAFTQYMVHDHGSDSTLLYTNPETFEWTLCLVPFSTIFVHTKQLGAFIEKHLPHIRVPFFLTSGMTDDDGTANARDAISNHSLLVAWYAHNFGEYYHPRIMHFPIGIRNTLDNHIMSQVSKWDRFESIISNGTASRDHMDWTRLSPCTLQSPPLVKMLQMHRYNASRADQLYETFRWLPLIQKLLIAKSCLISDPICEDEVLKAVARTTNSVRNAFDLSQRRFDATSLYGDASAILKANLAQVVINESLTITLPPGKTGLVVLAYSLTHRRRAVIHDALCVPANQKWLTCQTMGMDQLVKYLYWIAPIGAGVDNFRTWEAISSYSVAVMEPQGLDAAFLHHHVDQINEWSQVVIDSPILVVDDLTQLTVDHLLNALPRFANIPRQFPRRILSRAYWLERINFDRFLARKNFYYDVAAKNWIRIHSRSMNLSREDFDPYAVDRERRVCWDTPRRTDTARRRGVHCSTSD